MANFTPTDEQLAALETFNDEQDMVVTAVAGAGKTSTLRLLGEAAPGRKGIYFAYNKAIADDAKASFPSNVTCRTAHSLAFGPVGSRYKERLNGPRITAREAARLLGITHSLKLGDKELKPHQLARVVLDTVNKFCHSAEPDIRLWHVPHVQGVEGDAVYTLKREALSYAARAWEDIVEPDGRLKFEHDHYLKIWGLSQPRLDADFVLLDEAQDANPVIADIVERQDHTQRIMVGDSNQAIYGWRGATDAMQGFTGVRRTLSQSFRFGPAVADEANKWLRYLESDIMVRGFEKVDSRLEVLASPAAILCRTNAGAIQAAMAVHARGQRAALVGGGDQIRRLAVAAQELQQTGHTEHPELFMFTSWNEVREYSQEDDGGDLRVFVRLIEDMTAEGVIRAVDNLVEERIADVVVSTAHKAKGREWESVRIHTDFKEPEGEGEVSKAEAMLAYVAITRAKQVLDREGLAFIDRIIRRLDNPPAPRPTPSEVCDVCTLPLESDNEMDLVCGGHGPIGEI